MKRFGSLVLVVAVAAGLSACGGDSGDDDDDVVGPDAGGSGFACEGAGGSDRLFPFAVGYRWELKVTDPQDGSVSNKLVTVDEEMTPPGEDPVLVQTTTKPQGHTETWNRIQGDLLIRTRQQDFDQVGALELTTTYDPYELRSDESAAHVVTGAVWTESYTEAHFDTGGAMIDEVPTTDQWTVVSDSEQLTVPAGTITTVHVSRVRTVGGVADKEFWYAYGIGKVKETGGQTEELTGCEMP